MGREILSAYRLWPFNWLSLLYVTGDIPATSRSLIGERLKCQEKTADSHSDGVSKQSVHATRILRSDARLRICIFIVQLNIYL